MSPTQPAPGTTRLDALRVNVVRRTAELETRILHLLEVRKQGGVNDETFYLAKRKVEELLRSNQDLKKQLEYKGKFPFGKFRSGFIEAARCLAKSEEDAKRFDDLLASIVPRQYQHDYW